MRFVLNRFSAELKPWFSREFRLESLAHTHRFGLIVCEKSFQCQKYNHLVLHSFFLVSVKLSSLTISKRLAAPRVSNDSFKQLILLSWQLFTIMVSLERLSSKSVSIIKTLIESYVHPPLSFSHHHYATPMMMMVMLI